MHMMGMAMVVTWLWEITIRTERTMVMMQEATTMVPGTVGMGIKRLDMAIRHMDMVSLLSNRKTVYRLSWTSRSRLLSKTMGGPSSSVLMRRLCPWILLVRP
eukprot:XP_001710122.1 Hypothetical protein GL50803_31705 [Giardia lamblia ATCC 50803]